MKIVKGRPIDGKRRLRPTYLISVPKSSPTSTPTGYAESIQFLKDNPIIGGLQVRVDWTELEAGLGDYTDASLAAWAEIQGYLDDLKLPISEGGWRKLSILINIKRFDLTYDLVPAYLRDGVDGTYQDGQFDFPSGGGFTAGRNIKFQNANVRARFNALLAEFGRRFKNEDQIELVGFPEPVPGATPLIYTDYDEPSHLAGVLECLTALKNSMPYTIVRQISSGNRANLATFVPNLVTAGIPANGNADSVMDQASLGYNTPNKGLYQWHQQYGALGSNDVAVIMEVQNVNYAHTTLLVGLSPAPTWGTLTLADNGGALQLVGAGAHGVPTTATETVNTTDCGAALYMKSAAGNFPLAAYLKILSVDSATAMTVTNRDAWSSPTLAALGLNYSHVASRSLTDPWAGIRTANATSAYPLGNGFTYTPNANTYAGFVPLISEIMGFLDTDIKPTHIIFTYNTTVNTRTSKSNIECVVDYLRGLSTKNNIHGNLWITRPDNCN